MPRKKITTLDSNRRITINPALEERLTIPLGKDVAICYDPNEMALFFMPSSENIKKYRVLDFRTIDKVGRVTIGVDMLKLLHSTQEDDFILYLYKDRIYFKKIE